MTKREFLKVIVESEMAAEVVEFAKAELVKMDEALEKRKGMTSKTEKENAPLREQIYTEVLTNEWMTASAVAEVMSFSTQKASSLLRQLVKEGGVEVSEIKVPKKGTQKAYRKLAETETIHIVVEDDLV